MTSVQEPSRKPFLYVAIAGFVILLLYVLVSVDQTWRPGKHVIITDEQQQRIAANFERTWQRKPTDSEMNELLDSFARQEIAWREATRLALGRDDADIRRRLQQHLEAIAADDAVLVPATREELQTFLDDHADEFRVDPLLTFRQIHFDNTDNAIGADASARFLLGRLRNQDMPEDISKLGDPSPLPTHIEEVREPEISPLFGREFAAALSAAPVGEWIGPVPSRLGLHIVYIDQSVAGRIPDLDEIAEEVDEKWRAARRSVAIEDLYRRLAKSYDISIE
jgi:hypothetical protein